MGTDIHLVAEARDDHGQWQLVPGPIVDCWSCDGAGIYTMENRRNSRPEWLAKHLGQPCSSCTNPFDRYADDPNTPDDEYVQPGKRRDRWWSDRSYTVFAYLGNVRNGYGFAGVDTGDAVRPISDNRGFPDDLSAQAKAWFANNGGDHSASWCDLMEVLAYPWDELITKRGVVSPHEFAEMERVGYPSSWCGDISGPSIRKITATEMRRAIAKDSTLLTANRPRLFARVQWTVPARHYMEGFLDRMKQLAVTVGERPTRLVFDFDS